MDSRHSSHLSSVPFPMHLLPQAVERGRPLPRRGRAKLATKPSALPYCAKYWESISLVVALEGAGEASPRMKGPRTENPQSNKFGDSKHLMEGRQTSRSEPD